MNGHPEEGGSVLNGTIVVATASSTTNGVRMSRSDAAVHSCFYPHASTPLEVVLTWEHKCTIRAAKHLHLHTQWRPINRRIGTFWSS
jgi:hypothetical protein